MERTLTEMLAPQISESDATMVDIYGLKSKSADDLSAAHTALAGLGMIPAVGNIADAVDTMLYLSEGDWGGAGLSALSMLPFAGLFAGGLKTVKGSKKGKKALEELNKNVKKTGVKPSERMPRTSTSVFPDKSWSPTGASRGLNIPYQTKPDRLYRELTEGGLDTVEFGEKLRELQQIDPERAIGVLNELGF